MLQYVTYYSFFKAPCLPLRSPACVSRILCFFEVFQQGLAIDLPNIPKLAGLDLPRTNQPSKMVRMVSTYLNGFTRRNPLFIHGADSTVLPCLCNWHFQLFSCQRTICARLERIQPGQLLLTQSANAVPGVPGRPTDQRVWYTARPAIWVTDARLWARCARLDTF